MIFRPVGAEVSAATGSPAISLCAGRDRVVQGRHFGIRLALVAEAEASSMASPAQRVTPCCLPAISSMLFFSSATTCHFELVGKSVRLSVPRERLSFVPSRPWRALGTSTTTRHLPRWASRKVVSRDFAMLSHPAPAYPNAYPGSVPQRGLECLGFQRNIGVRGLLSGVPPQLHRRSVQVIDLLALHFPSARR